MLIVFNNLLVNSEIRVIKVLIFIIGRITSTMDYFTIANKLKSRVQN